MHCSYFSGRINVEKTPEQYNLSYRHSHKAKEDTWWDMHSSGRLDDEQVDDEDEGRGYYIRGKALW